MIMSMMQNCYRFVIQKSAVLSPSHASLLSRPETLAKGSNMSLLQLIILASWAGMFLFGYKLGHRDGYIVGRKAVRKHYAQLDQVRA
jgi:hypothetical protein